tara:strand:- start:1381 stop:1626 length:246 start_codon:yes stop_codon:yes gene_type:complete
MKDRMNEMTERQLLNFIETLQNKNKLLEMENLDIKHKLSNRMSLDNLKKHVNFFYRWTTSVFIWGMLIFLWLNSFCFYVAK